MIPILESNIQETKIEGVVPLTKFFNKNKKIKNEKLPQFFLFHGRSKAIIPCPYQWTEDWSPNAEFVLLWAIEEALKLDIAMSNEMIELFKSEESQQEGEQMTDE